MLNLLLGACHTRAAVAALQRQVPVIFLWWPAAYAGELRRGHAGVANAVIPDHF